MTRTTGWILFLIVVLLYWLGLGLAAFCDTPELLETLRKSQVDLPAAYRLTHLVVSSPLNLLLLLLGLPIVLAIPLLLIKSDTLRAWIEIPAVVLLTILPMFALFSIAVFLANFIHLLAPQHA